MFVSQFVDNQASRYYRPAVRQHVSDEDDDDDNDELMTSSRNEMRLFSCDALNVHSPLMYSFIYLQQSSGI